MFFRLLWESFRRQRRRKLLAGVAILLGTTAVTAMLALATTIGDRIHRELAVYGANIVVTPAASGLDVNVGGVNLQPATGDAYLRESDLEKLKGIFWANNITGVSPELSEHLYVAAASSESSLRTGLMPTVVEGLWFAHRFGDLTTGAPELHPWWQLQGTWPRQMDASAINHAVGAVVGLNLARVLNLKIGDQLIYSAYRERLSTSSDPKQGYVGRFEVTGVVTAGDETDNKVLIPLSAAQLLLPYANHLTQGMLIGNAANGPLKQTAALTHLLSITSTERAISRVELSARTRPEDAFARKDPETLSPSQREIWYCRPYANSIAFQIREAIPGANAEQVRRVEQSEGNVLKRISGLMWLVSLAALVAAGFAVSAAMTTAILERRGEIGLLRSLGASRGAVATLFYVEATVLALGAGACGFLLGSGIASWMGRRIFPGDAPGAVFNPVLLPVVIGLALLVAIAGSTPAIRQALNMEPSAVLRAGA